jgi:DNA-binding MarR family transcriptional regulator
LNLNGKGGGYMSFTGNLKTVSLPDIFQLIFTTKKTGVLSIVRGDETKEIYFKSGLTVYATSSSEQDLFGNILLKQGRISKEELMKVLNEKKEGKKIGAALVEKGLFTREEILDCLRMQIEEIIYGLFGWKDGEFKFAEGKTPPSEAIQTELNPMNIIMEGTRRIDEWEELKKILPADNAILELEKNPVFKTEQVRLSHNEITVMALIGSGIKMIDLLKESSLDQFHTSKSLANLMQLGLINVGEEVVEEKKPVVDETEELIKLLANIYRHNFGIIRDSLTEKMGLKGEKLFVETFQMHKSDYPLLAGNLSGRQGEMGFELLSRLARSLPDEAKMHRIIVSFNDLLTDYLNTIQKYLGKKMFRRTVSQLKINTLNNINRKKQLSLKWGLEEEFNRALRSL